MIKTKKSVKFSNKEAALKFAEKVNGKVNDLTRDPNARSKYSVTFEAKQKPTKGNFFMEENHFHYPNEFWQ